LIKFSKTIQDLPREENCVRIFTDGACLKNPGGPGGWSYIAQFQTSTCELRDSGGALSTTNNRMELMAAIKALESLRGTWIVELVTDSVYVGKGLAEWRHRWKRLGWRVKNADLWRRLSDVADRHEVYVTHIIGHSGQPENEECDRVASSAAKRFMY
jgi:ribonuclease HI